MTQSEVKIVRMHYSIQYSRATESHGSRSVAPHPFAALDRSVGRATPAGEPAPAADQTQLGRPADAWSYARRSIRPKNA
jgi:hypothetical protein